MVSNHFVWILLALASLSSFAKALDNYEGDCKDFNPPVAEGLDQTWILESGPEGYYVPMASRLLYYGVSLLLDGKFYKTKKVDYERICMRLTAGSLFTSVMAFGNKTVMECRPGSKAGQRECTLATSRIFEEMNRKRIYPMKGVVTLMEARKNYFVLSLCLGEKVKMWMALSTTSDGFDEEITNKIQEHVTKDLGFDNEKIDTLKYDKCVFEHVR